MAFRVTGLSSGPYQPLFGLSGRALASLGIKRYIVGPRTPGQLADNLASVDVQLTADQLERLDAASA
jgi:hypothetical protein